MSGSIEPYDTAKGRRYRIRYRKPDGTQTSKRGFKTQKEAKLRLADITVTKAKGDYVDPTAGRRTLTSYANTWKIERLAPLKPSSRHAMETAWRVHVEPKWGTRAVDRITHTEIAAWVAELNTTRSAQTVRRIVFVLNGILTIAHRENAIPRNPATGITLPAKRRKPPRYLTHQQVDTLVRSADTNEHATLIDLFAHAGLRWGEAAALRVRHLNPLRKRIRIEDNAVMVKGTYEHGTPKPGHTRDVPMPHHLVDQLTALTDGKGPDDYLFGDGTNPIPYPHATSGWFVKAVRAARQTDPTIPAITPHDLRHTAASLAVASGAHVKAIQRMLGHASAAMTLDVYADLFDDDLDAVAARMNEHRAAALGVSHLHAAR
ncbi:MULTISPECIES: tyrosine-type recombinase/integrase [unclassified Microbacterium]|uniref:tyrosine-type recombinase/integrase n=1 Tax=Microbacterium TaxID=33882 RepID=UPI003BA31555